MANEYAPPTHGTPPEEWTDEQRFEHDWICETVYDDMREDPECRDLNEAAFEALWQKYVDWYFWGDRRIPGHEDEYE